MARNDQVLGAKVRVPRPVVQPRDRLAALFEAAWAHAVTLVVAPAGSGKTTALAQFAAHGAARGSEVAWYRAESSEGAVGDLLRHVAQALNTVRPGLVGDWETVEAAAAALDSLDSADPRPVALVIDDFHTLEGTPAESAVGDLVEYLPSSIHLLLGARRPPAIDLSRLRVSGRLAELGPEDLRFRTWEVETLFRDHYGEPLPPVELAELTRRTDGWAAGLQLFHLATRGKPVLERRRVLRSLSTRLRSVREYLARNLLDGLDDELRTFLLRTSVLGHLSPPMCDELLGRADSAHLLAEAERRHLFLTSDDEGATYRSHEVLRSHLAEMLIDEVGEQDARVLQQRAGVLLEAAGDSAEALFAYWRAQDWSAADRLLATHTEIMGGTALGLEAIPPGLTDRDGWVLLATARRHLAMGAWGPALDTYRRGEAMFGGGRPSETCRRERTALVAWLDPKSASGGDWTSHLRRAMQREPLAVAAVLESLPDLGDTAPAHLAAGLAAAAAGHLTTAGRHLGAAGDHPGASPVIAGFAGFAAAVIHRMRVVASGGGDDGKRELAGATEVVDAVTPPWMGRLAQGFAADSPGDGRRQLSWARDLPDVAANPWAAAVLALLASAAALADGEAPAAAEAAGVATAGFEALGAGVGVAWGHAFGALAAAASGDPHAQRAAVAALQTARAADCPGAMALACRVGVLAGLPEGLAPLLATAGALEGAGAVSLQNLVDRLWAGR
ncbi:MAG TPA: AAA family ATPase, partial [Acidimicrobiales bacterium]|nr:AAA family ATPase [Acidimicrobiales bacterium]